MQEYGVAVGLRSRDKGGADIAAGTRFVFDHDVLAEDGTELFS